MKISLITVCYESAGTLAAAMESVLEQKGAEVEYLVVDGGSKDGTVELLKEYEGKFGGRMRWTSEPDRGMYDAINKGIARATGDVVGILNADDAFQTDHALADVAAAFTEHQDAQAVYGDVRFIRGNVATKNTEDTKLGSAAREGPLALPREPQKGAFGSGLHALGPVLQDLRTAKTVRYYSAKKWRPWMLRWGYMPPHPGLYIRRADFAKFGGYKVDYRIAADYELIVRYLWDKGLKAAYLPGCLVTMRMGGKSTRGWRSNLLLNEEIVRGVRENGYICCLPMMAPKYVFKVWEFILPRMER